MVSKLFRNEEFVLEAAREYAGTKDLELFIEYNGFTEEQADYIRNATHSRPKPNS